MIWCPRARLGVQIVLWVMSAPDQGCVGCGGSATAWWVSSTSLRLSGTGLGPFCLWWSEHLLCACDLLIPAISGCTATASAEGAVQHALCSSCHVLCSSAAAYSALLLPFQVSVQGAHGRATQSSLARTAGRRSVALCPGMSSPGGCRVAVTNTPSPAT